jgi:hypothetical protein
MIITKITKTEDGIIKENGRNCLINLGGRRKAIDEVLM